LKGEGTVDSLNIKSDFMKSIVSKFVTKIAKKNIGDGTDVEVKDIGAYCDEENVVVSLNIKLTTKRSNLYKILEKVL
jgi:hypothetical protein